MIKNQVDDKLSTTIKGIARGYPAISGFSAFLYSIITGKNEGYFLLGSLFAVEYLNMIFKNYIAKPLMGDKKWPILGWGIRPKGAKNTGCFVSEDDVKNNVLSKSYGMPSGHAQSSTFFSTYVILMILNSSNHTNPIKKWGGIGVMGLLGLFVPASRVYLNCHTVQQVVLGSAIGIGLGVLTHYLKTKYLPMI